MQHVVVVVTPALQSAVFGVTPALETVVYYFCSGLQSETRTYDLRIKIGVDIILPEN
ncbi:hypothetical protein DPMN_171709 [Dreissena polymorpha]|uniref:Uncharacterized protein n=1 Tax=Dreissena polymorpha TaxID=45954 RepID=A0A9D4IFE1_DREPO|nr:hypothetical protein DPMN_171709 [Dreissena polymorpha]